MAILWLCASTIPAPAINVVKGAEAGSVTAGATGVGWLLLMTVNTAKAIPAMASRGRVYFICIMLR